MRGWIKMLKTLQRLQDSTSVQNDLLWRLSNIAPDGSGELTLDEIPVAIFNDQDELQTYVTALSGHEHTLTIANISEILKEVQF